ASTSPGRPLGSTDGRRRFHATALRRPLKGCARGCAHHEPVDGGAAIEAIRKCQMRLAGALTGSGDPGSKTNANATIAKPRAVAAATRRPSLTGRVASHVQSRQAAHVVTIDQARI